VQLGFPAKHKKKKNVYARITINDALFFGLSFSACAILPYTLSLFFRQPKWLVFSWAQEVLCIHQSEPQLTTRTPGRVTASIAA
jgi:hypothetical protein